MLNGNDNQLNFIFIQLCDSKNIKIKTKTSLVIQKLNGFRFNSIRILYQLDMEYDLKKNIIYK